MVAIGPSLWRKISRIPSFRIFLHCSDKIKHVPLFLSHFLYLVFVYARKTGFKILKHKLPIWNFPIWKWQGKGGTASLMAWFNPNTWGIQHWWPQRDLCDHAQVRYPDFSYSQLKSPKEFVLCIHYEEQLWTYTITFMTEELRNSKREREPRHME